MAAAPRCRVRGSRKLYMRSAKGSPSHMLEGRMRTSTSVAGPVDLRVLEVLLLLQDWCHRCEFGLERGRGRSRLRGQILQ